jgi:ADP-ribose pyrophosphatase YjhB (NUDIX family)
VETGDVSWRNPDAEFNLRTAAIITRGDSVLLCTVPGAGCWFLPGGRVRFGEATDRALARELAEELGHQLPPGRLVLVMENIYTDRWLRHEIGMYYHQEWPDSLAADDIHGGSEPADEFRWVKISELETAGFQPAGIIGLLAHLPQLLRHVVNDRLAGTLLIDGAARPGSATSRLASLACEPVQASHRIRHDPPDQLGAGRQVVDEPGHLA